MSLHRQLLLAILVSIALAFIGSLTTTLVAARQYHEQQLAVKNADNAAALALAMSQLPKDRATIDVQVVTLFETGNYQSIRIIDSLGAELVTRTAQPPDSGVPRWFVDLLPINSTPGTAMISDGFRQFGTVELTSVTTFASLDLYRSAQNNLLVFVVINGALSALAIAILARLRKPLANIVEQAQGMIERRYLVFPLPAVPELRTVGEAMNQMVERIQGLFAEEAERLDAMRRAANIDELTGLSTRSYFMKQLRGALDPQAATGAGVMVLFRLRDLAGINLMAGRPAVDQLLKQSAEIAARHAGTTPQAFAGRLNGADFAMLLPGCAQAQAWADDVDRQLAALLLGWGDAVSTQRSKQSAVPLAATAATEYSPGEEISALMARLDNALAQAECGKGGGVVAAHAATRPLGSQEWRDRLQRAIDQRWITLEAFTTQSADGSEIHRECFARLRLDEGGEWLPVGRFLPQLSRLKLTADFDLAVAGELAQFAGTEGRVALNLSSDSLAVAGFGARLAALVAAVPGLAPRLSIDLPESGIYAFPDGFHDVVQHMKALGCRVGADHYGRESKRIGQLQGSGLDYVKIDASFINGLTASRESQDFLRGVCNICHKMNLAVYALGVTHRDDLAQLFELGFDGATGPAVGIGAGKTR